MLPPCCHDEPGTLLWQYFFYMSDALHVAQQTASKHWRQKCCNTCAQNLLDNNDDHDDESGEYTRLLVLFENPVGKSLECLLTGSRSSVRGFGADGIVRPNILSAPEDETFGNWTDGRMSCRHSAATWFLVVLCSDLVRIVEVTILCPLSCHSSQEIFPL